MTGDVGAKLLVHAYLVVNGVAGTRIHKCTMSVHKPNAAAYSDENEDVRHDESSGEATV